MIYRQVMEHDIPDLARLQHKHPDFSSLRIDKYLVDGVVVDKNESVAAYGIVMPFAEAVFLPDTDRSDREKVEALKLLLYHAVRGTDNAGLRQLHCFIRDKKFVEIMKKHFGFEPCVGEALVLNLQK